MVITGAGPGIMEAGIEGAGAANSFGVSIRLPFEAATTQFLADDPEARELPLLLHAQGDVREGGARVRAAARRLRHARRGVRAPHARADRQVGAGADRAARRARRHLLAELDRSSSSASSRTGATSPPRDLELFCITDDVHVALAEVTGFYRNYHSLRFVDGDLVLRMQSLPSDAALAALNHDFADIITSGRDRAGRREQGRDRRPRRARPRPRCGCASTATRTRGCTC